MVFSFIALTLGAQENTNQNSFRQLGQDLPTPNSYRTASGAPGVDYWQQKADYKMKIEIDDENAKLHGTSNITYKNNSPDELRYLWLQLDQNVRAQESDSPKLRGSSVSERPSLRGLKRMNNDFDGGFKVESVTNSSNQAMSYTINKTMMRIDLPKPLKAGDKTSFNISCDLPPPW